MSELSHTCGSEGYGACDDEKLLQTIHAVRKDKGNASRLSMILRYGIFREGYSVRIGI